MFMIRVRVGGGGGGGKTGDLVFEFFFPVQTFVVLRFPYLPNWQLSLY